MEPRDSTSVIYSLKNFIKLQQEGAVAVEPNRCLIVWQSRNGHENKAYDTVYCLRQTNDTFLRQLQDTSGHVMSFPLYYVHNYNPESFPGSFDSEFHISGFEVTESCRAILEFIRQELLLEPESPSAKGLQAEIIKSLVRVFVLRLSQHTGSCQLATENRGDVHFVDQFLQLINVHFATKKKVADYAEIMCVSANYLTVRIRETTRQPASYHIQQRILVEAKRLILQNRFRLKEVACKLGYPDTAHFSKWFKNMEGINFTTYQREACRFVKRNRS